MNTMKLKNPTALLMKLMAYTASLPSGHVLNDPSAGSVSPRNQRRLSKKR